MPAAADDTSPPPQDGHTARSDSASSRAEPTIIRAEPVKAPTKATVITAEPIAPAARHKFGTANGRAREAVGEDEPTSAPAPALLSQPEFIPETPPVREHDGGGDQIIRPTIPLRPARSGKRMRGAGAALALVVICIAAAAVVLHTPSSGSQRTAAPAVASSHRGPGPKHLTAAPTTQPRPTPPPATRVTSNGSIIPLPRRIWRFPPAGQWVAETLLTISNSTRGQVRVQVIVGRVSRRIAIPGLASAEIALGSDEAREPIRVIAGGPVIPQRSLIDARGGAHSTYGLSDGTTR